MYTVRRRRRANTYSSRQLVAFLLIASFGILFAGCSPKEDKESSPAEEFTFTADDIQKFKELSESAEEEISELNENAGPKLDLRQENEPPVIDLSMVETFNSIRTGPAAAGENLFRVTNEFVNVRSAPNVTSEVIDRILKGDTVSLIEFADAAWAHVKLASGRDGYVVQRYIAELVSEKKLSEEKEKYKDMYFVDFGFLNVRKSADTNSEKIGELKGQSFVKILSMDNVWARIPFEGKEGYAAKEYLSPFLPNFLVRQDEFTFPVLQYRANQDGAVEALAKHIEKIRADGFKLITLRNFKDLLLEQEERDVRLAPKSAAIVITGIDAENLAAVSSALRLSGLNATLFVETRHLGMEGITQADAINVVANGNDLQPAGHSGDDLRSLTNAQIDLELKQSRKLLEEYTGKPVFAVSYPLGGVNSRVEEKAAEAGYLIGIGTGQERVFLREQLLRIPSFVISPSASAEEIAGLVKGE